MTNSEARKRMQAVSGPEMALSRPQTANLGDGANGRLSEAERADVLSQVDRPTSQRRPQILAAVERIVREHTERAWDEGVAWTGLNVTFAKTSNPYRAARQEQDRG